METMKAIELRESCRGYKVEQITKNELTIILQAANAAPIGRGDYTRVQLTVIQNSGLLEKFNVAAAIFFKNPNLKPTYGAPTIILVSAKIVDSQQDPSPYCNAACIVENMTLAATDLGLGSVYILGAVTALSKNSKLCTEMKIAQNFIPVSAIAIGIPSNPFRTRALSVSKIVTTYIN